LVSIHSSPGGHERAGALDISLFATARELAARGVAVDVITRAAEETHTRDLAPGLTHHAIATTTDTRVSGGLATLTDEFGEAVARLSRSTHYDLMHAHYWRSGIAALPVAIELGIPFVQSYPTLGALNNTAGIERESDRRLWSERYLANQADAIVAWSSAEAAILMDDVGAPADRIWVIPPGVDSAQFAPHRTEMAVTARAFIGVAKDRPLVMLAGRIDPLRNLELAIRAIGAIEGPRPLLLVIGDASPGSESYLLTLRGLVGSLGLTDDVRFLGAVEHQHVANLLTGTSLVLITSAVETYGLVALEAAASGIPVIAMDAAGLRESVVDGVTGELVASTAPDDWARAISALLADAPRRSALGFAARTRAEGLSWAATATSLLGVYASLR
jgi:D-inositol-3-phosphate glycosyltransferase